MRTYAIASKSTLQTYWSGGSYRFSTHPGESVAFPTEEEAAHELATWPQEVRDLHRVVAIGLDVESEEPQQASDFSPETS